MKGVLLAFLGTLTLLDVTCGKKCDDVVKEAKKAFLRNYDMRHEYTTMQSFDTNVDSKITLEEFKKGIETHHPKLSPIAEGLFKKMSGPGDNLTGAKIANFLAGMDTNYDAVVSPKEVDEFWEKTFQPLFKAALTDPATCTW